MAQDRLLVALAVGLAVLGGHAGLEQRTLRGVVGPDPVGVDEVLAHLAVEGEEVLHDVARRVAEVLDGGGVALHGPGRELVAAGVGDQPGVGLVPDPQAVLGEQRRGVGVVRRDGRLLDLVLVGIARPSRASRVGSSPAWRRLSRIRLASSAVALVVKVRPRISPGATRPVATSQTTRAAITVVLPEPAPAITTAGSSGAVIAANCWALNVKSSPSRSRSCSGVRDVAGRHESTVPAALSGQMAWKVQRSQCVAGTGHELLGAQRRGRLHQLLLDEPRRRRSGAGAAAAAGPWAGRRRAAAGPARHRPR